MQVVITVLLMIIVAGVFIALVVGSTHITAPPSYDPTKKWIANNFIAGALIFTFYGIMYTLTMIIVSYTFVMAMCT